MSVFTSINKDTGKEKKRGKRVGGKIKKNCVSKVWCGLFVYTRVLQKKRKRGGGIIKNCVTRVCVCGCLFTRVFCNRPVHLQGGRTYPAFTPSKMLSSSSSTAPFQTCTTAAIAANSCSEVGSAVTVAVIEWNDKVRLSDSSWVRTSRTAYCRTAAYSATPAPTLSTLRFHAPYRRPVHYRHCPALLFSAQNGRN